MKTLYLNLPADRALAVRRRHLGQLGAGRGHKEAQADEGQGAERQHQREATSEAADLPEVPRQSPDDEAAQNLVRLFNAKGIVVVGQSHNVQIDGNDLI